MDFDQPPASPVDALRSWLEDAECIDRPNPNAMTLATIDPDGAPSARVVLLKDLDEDGVVFYSNRESRKGRALAAHPSVGGADFCMITETSIDEVVEHLGTEGVEIIVGPDTRSGALGPITSVYFRDPDDNLVEVSNYPE